MSTPNFRDGLRPKLRVNEVAKLQRENPDRVYCGVRFDEDYDPNAANVDHYESKGWRVESDTYAVGDDRPNVSGHNDEESLRKHPLIKKGKGKAQFVIMSIDKETLAKNEAAKVAANEARFVASSSGRKVRKQGGKTTITDSEVTIDGATESDTNNDDA